MNRKRTLSKKIFLYMIGFALTIMVTIGLGTKFLLPAYYLEIQMNRLDELEASIRTIYDSDSEDELTAILEDARNVLGGELYYFSEGESGSGRGSASHIGLQSINGTSEKFQPSGDVTVYSYENKIGLEVHVIGVRLKDSYLVYEVGIQQLNQAADTMIRFIFWILLFVFLLAVVLSTILSRKISKPIRELNRLATKMKEKEVSPYMVTHDINEIGELNQTLNELYEELLGNIYQLQTELSKERNSELLKKRFLAQATHELKTPIAVIRGYSEILYDGMYKDADERDRFLKNIYDETEAVSHLILDVLDYTKMETGNYKLSVKQTPVFDFLKSLTERYDEYIKSNGINYLVELELEPGFKREIDQNRFEQVYKNLISNAVEHAKNQIRVHASQVGSKIRICVYNDGNRISEEDLPNVFESFYKREGKKSGVGLGLAIVKEIVLLHHGEYRVKNHEDGVEFVIVI